MNSPSHPHVRGNHFLRPSLYVVLLVLPTLVGISQVRAAELTPARLSFYVQKLQAKQRATRLAAIKALGNLGTAAKPALPHLAQLLRHRDRGLHNQAAAALAQVGPAALPVLREALQDDRVAVRLGALEALAAMGRDAQPALADLLALAIDKRPTLRVAALQAALAIDPHAKSVDAALGRAVKDKDRYVALSAALALQQLKEPSEKRPPADFVNPLALLPRPRLTPAQELIAQQLVTEYITNDTNYHHGQAGGVMVQTGYMYLHSAAGRSTQAIILTGGPEFIPVMVRGANYALTIGGSCPSASFLYHLREQVEVCNDPELLDYLLLNLGRGVPPKREYWAAIAVVREAALRRKSELALLVIEAKRQADFNRLVARLLELNDTALLARLTDSDPDTRLAAVVAVARRRLHAEEPLFDRLDDTDPRVVQAARQTLALLARGTDFGPPAKAKRAARRLAQRRWRTWWSWQDGNPKARKFPPVELPPPVPLAQQMADTLVKAPAARKPALLARLRKGVGVEYTEALADAASRLDEPFRAQAREILAARLRRVTPKQLRDMLKGQDAELRRAAAQACGARADREFVPDLIGPLADPDPEVSAAARAALRTLTGEDFGPADKASLKQREAAAKKWRAWWAKQEGQ